MRIRLIGQRNTTGIGTHYACFADQLKAQATQGFAVEEIDFQNGDQINQAIATSDHSDINISFVGANIHQHFHGINIQWIVFETDRVPDIIMPCVQAADQVWVPSTWGQNVLIQNGVASSRIRVVPEGVDSHSFSPDPQRLADWTRPFRFLTISKYERRKGIDETMESFAAVFGNRPDVELLIKSHYHGNVIVDSSEKFRSLNQKIAELGVNNIKLLWGEIVQDDLIALYRRCDAFVLPTRGEGWGLPLIEAAASGLPIISTMYGGQVEFLSKISSSVLAVDFDIVPVDCEEFKRYYPGDSWGHWARPQIHSLQQCMSRAWEQRHLLTPAAVSNSEQIRSQFGWDKSVECALHCLSTVKKQQNQ